MRRFALLLGVALSPITTSAVAQICDGFVDVLASSPFCPDVTWLKTYGITKGCDATHFCPTDNVSRLQMAAFMHRLGNNPAFVNGGNAFGTTAFLGTTDNQPLTVLVNNQPALRLIPVDNVTYSNVVNVVNGSPLNSIDAGVVGATIAGGGGSITTSSDPNHITFSFATIGGGAGNTASGNGATVAGGFGNTASGQDAAVPGGLFNTASGFASFAGGNRAKATTDGSFIWADSQNFDFGPSVSNFFGVRATGGVGLTIAIDPTTGAVTQFCNLLPPIASWSCTSDRDAKENFIPTEGKDILQRLVAMPLFSWNFKGADPTIRSLGPTAQDFYAAFGLGRNDKSIANVNLEGVALAALQGLNAKVDEQTTLLQSRLESAVQEKNRQLAEQAATIRVQQREIAELSERVQKAETLAADVVALKAALAELQRGRETVAVK
jgi:hypothetical protein